MYWPDKLALGINILNIELKIVFNITQYINIYIFKNIYTARKYELQIQDMLNIH